MKNLNNNNKIIPFNASNNINQLNIYGNNFLNRTFYYYPFFNQRNFEMNNSINIKNIPKIIIDSNINTSQTNENNVYSSNINTVVKQKIIDEPKPQENIISNIYEKYEKSEDKISLIEEKNKIYNCNTIISILKKNSFPDKIIEKIKEDFITPKFSQAISLFEIKNKRKRNRKKINDIEKEEVKRGRKTLFDNNNERKHKKESQDNIIKKIKALFFTSVVEYIEIFLNQYKKNYIGVIKLLKLDYAKYVNRIKKDVNLKLLDTPLKDLVSLDTSKMYRKNEDICWNKKIIDKIIVKEKDNKPINDLLNMSFIEWIDIFLYKKDWEYTINFNKFKSFLEKISLDDDDQYLSKFILYMYNYKRWFLNKKGRCFHKNDE